MEVDPDASPTEKEGSLQAKLASLTPTAPRKLHN
jgi:hypothetical protein